MLTGTHPSALVISGLEIYWYGITAATAVLILYFFPYQLTGDAYQQRITKTHAYRPGLFLGLLLFGWVGSKFVYAAGMSSYANPFEQSRVGASIFGLVLGSTIFLAAYCYIKRVPFLSLADRFLLNAPVAIAAIRLGNLINGEGWGYISQGPVQLNVPSQALEGALCILFFWWYHRERKNASAAKPAGLITARFMMGYGCIRLLVESTRISEFTSATYTSGTIAIFGSICLIGCGITLATHFRRSRFAAPPVNSMSFSGTVVSRNLGVPTVAGGFALLTMGCGGPRPDIPSSPAPKVSLRYSNPAPSAGSDSRCTYPGSRAAFIHNADPVPRNVSWDVVKTDSQGRVYPPQFGKTYVVKTPAGSLGEQIGCTIDTSGAFYNEYRYINATAQLVVPNSLRKRLVGRTFATAPVCDAICSAQPSPGSGASCLELGARYYSAIAPIAALVEQARSKGRDVSKAELLQTAHAEERDDLCHRGGVDIGKDGIIRNSGPTQVCSFSSTDLPTKYLNAFGGSSLRRAPTRMYGGMYSTIEMAVGPAIRSAGTSNVVAQSVRDETAPFVLFDGAGGTKLTANYGGPIHSISKIAVAGRPRQTVLTTANGCIAVSEQ